MKGSPNKATSSSTSHTVDSNYALNPIIEEFINFKSSNFTDIENMLKNFKDQSEALKGFIEKAVQYLLRDENRIGTFIELLRMFLVIPKFVQDQDSYRKRKEMLSFFHVLYEAFEETSHQLDKWKDEFGMTLLMRVLISSKDTSTHIDRHMLLLLESIIRKEYFDDNYINLKTATELQERFELQHFHNICKEEKKKNTVIAHGQEIYLKKIKRIENGEYLDTFGRMINGQVKMVSKEPIELEGKGKKRAMLTVTIPETTNQSNNVFPEHFDTDSIDTVTSDIISAFKKEYKVSNSVSTKVLHSPEKKTIDESICEYTNLSLLASKTKSWGVMKAIIVELPKENYPTLFSREGLYSSDASKAHCLQLAIEDGQIDICTSIIKKVDLNTIKSVNNLNGKTAKKLICELFVQKGKDCCEPTNDIEDLKKCIEEKLRTCS